MIKTNLFKNTEVHQITEQKGCLYVLEYERDISVTPMNAMNAYFASKMNVRKRQLVAKMDGEVGVIVQSGAMQMMMGDLKAATNIKGAGDLMKKFVGSKITKEKVIKPQYVGTGVLVLEPTFRYIILEDLENWNGEMVIEDGMFLACENTANITVTARKTISSIVLGKEGLFNTTIKGSGVVAMESPVPANELIIVDMVDDTLKIDGNMAIAWSHTLSLTVERTTKTLVGSAASGEGLLNTYRGTGRVLIAPVECNYDIDVPEQPEEEMIPE